jgi:hypothetical protein
MQKRKRWIFILIFSLLLIGCIFWKQIGEKMTKVDYKKGNELNGKDYSSSEQLASKEFLKELFGVTEVDIVKYEVEEFISAFGLTEEFFYQEKEALKYPNEDIINIFAELQKDLHAPKMEENYDFSYLYEAIEYAGEFPNIDTLSYLTASEYMGDGGSSFVIDFRKNKIYFDYKVASVFRDIRRAEEVLDITEIERDEIINALKEIEFYKWDYSYVDKKDPNSEAFWDFGMEFGDGTIISYNGRGVFADSYFEFSNVIFGMVKRE